MAPRNLHPSARLAQQIDRQTVRASTELREAAAALREIAAELEAFAIAPDDRVGPAELRQLAIGVSSAAIRGTLCASTARALSERFAMGAALLSDGGL